MDDPGVGGGGRFCGGGNGDPIKEKSRPSKSCEAIDRAIHGRRAEGNGHSPADAGHKKEPTGMMALVFPRVDQRSPSNQR